MLSEANNFNKRRDEEGFVTVKHCERLELLRLLQPAQGHNRAEMYLKQVTSNTSGSECKVNKGYY